MTDETRVTIELNQERAIVFFEWLFELLEESHSLDARTPELLVLGGILAHLEREIEETGREDYLELVDTARSRIIGGLA